ncbi:MAG: hypothetical protein KDA92_03690 [Planctomycetales bacterium]|nr:hypothetical protein [Planctomycetales bacterium]MCA9169424.1 hypothetical protein [Planctomycetales bacterium]
MSIETIHFLLAAVFLAVWGLCWYIVTRVAGHESRRTRFVTKKASDRLIDPRPHILTSDDRMVKPSRVES